MPLAAVAACRFALRQSQGVRCGGGTIGESRERRAVGWFLDGSSPNLVVWDDLAVSETALSLLALEAIGCLDRAEQSEPSDLTPDG